MASAALLRDAFVKASNYRQKRAQADSEGKPFDRDLRMEPLVAVLERRLPLRLHAHRADDILTALRIRDEFGFDLTLEHATEGAKVAGLLASPESRRSSGRCSSREASTRSAIAAHTTPAELTAAGVKVAIITDHPIVPIEHLWLQAMVAVREGMSRVDALRAVTTNPAEICGIGDRVGQLVAGADADIQVLGGPPFDVMSRVEKVYVSGRLAFERGGGA